MRQHETFDHLLTPFKKYKWKEKVQSGLKILVINTHFNVRLS